MNLAKLSALFIIGEVVVLCFCGCYTDDGGSSALGSAQSHAKKRGSSHGAPTPSTGDVMSLAAGGKVLFFFDTGCPDCQRVKEEHLPYLLEREGLHDQDLVQLDVAEESTIRMLFELEKRLGFRATILAPIVVVENRPLCGLESIMAYLVNDEMETRAGL